MKFWIQGWILQPESLQENKNLLVHVIRCDIDVIRD